MTDLPKSWQWLLSGQEIDISESGKHRTIRDIDRAIIDAQGMIDTCEDHPTMRSLAPQHRARLDLLERVREKAVERWGI